MPFPRAFFEDGIRGMGRIGFHEVHDRLIVVIGGKSDASRVDDGLPIGEPDHAWNMAVAAEDHGLPYAAEKTHDFGLGSNHRPHRTHVFQEVGGIACRRTVAKEYLAVDYSRGRKRFQPGERVVAGRSRAKIIGDKRQGAVCGKVLGRGIEDSTVLIPGHCGNPTGGAKQTIGVEGLERAIKGVAQVDEPGDAPVLRVAQDGVQGERISVNIGYDRE